MRLASQQEAFIDDKTKWISDKFFAQQRLAGNNPLSIERVTLHGEGMNGTILKRDRQTERLTDSD